MKKKMIIIPLMFLLVGGALTLKLTRGYFFPLSIGIRHFINILFAPKDLYQPIVMDKFLFYERGFTKTYILKPKRLDIYEIGFLVDNGGLESTYKFNGKIKMEFYWKDKLLYDNTITSIASASYKQNDMSKFRQISLSTFNIPVQNKYATDISLKITVLEPDVTLKKYEDSLNLYIAVCAVP